MKIHQHMQVVFHAIDPVHMAFFVFKNCGDVTKQNRAAIGMEGPLPVFCTENNMIKDLGVGTHKGDCWCVCWSRPLPEL